MPDSKFQELKEVLKDRVCFLYGSNYNFSKSSSISHATLVRFVRDGRDIRLSSLIKLSDALGLEIKIVGKNAE